MRYTLTIKTYAVNIALTTDYLGINPQTNLGLRFKYRYEMNDAKKCNLIINHMCTSKIL